jgi:S-adenosylmethionine/arginine decarboxylase-like enzyme
MPLNVARVLPPQHGLSRVLDLSGVEDIRSIYHQEQAWGMLTSLDVYDCNPVTIRDGQAIGRFAAQLCDRLKVTAYGEPIVVNFGRGAVEGYSLVQLIETSLISGHFANETNRAFIDIFSCCFYDPLEAARFATDFFGGQGYNISCILRK